MANSPLVSSYPISSGGFTSPVTIPVTFNEPVTFDNDVTFNGTVVYGDIEIGNADILHLLSVGPVDAATFLVNGDAGVVQVKTADAAEITIEIDGDAATLSINDTDGTNTIAMDGTTGSITGQLYYLGTATNSTYAFFADGDGVKSNQGLSIYDSAGAGTVATLSNDGALTLDVPYSYISGGDASYSPLVITSGATSGNGVLPFAFFKYSDTASFTTNDGISVLMGASTTRGSQVKWVAGATSASDKLYFSALASSGIDNFFLNADGTWQSGSDTDYKIVFNGTSSGSYPSSIAFGDGLTYINRFGIQNATEIRSTTFIGNSFQTTGTNNVVTITNGTLNLSGTTVLTMPASTGGTTSSSTPRVAGYSSGWSPTVTQVTGTSSSSITVQRATWFRVVNEIYFSLVITMTMGTVSTPEQQTYTVTTPFTNTFASGYKASGGGFLNITGFAPGVCGFLSSSGDSTLLVTIAVQTASGSPSATLNLEGSFSVT